MFESITMMLNPFVLVLLLLVTSTQARVLHVRAGAEPTNVTTCTSPSDPCGTIQQAVDLAENGDDILVQEGVYEENVQIGSPTNVESNTNRNVHIQGVGVGKTVVTSGASAAQRPGPADIIFDVWTENIKITNLTIFHPGAAAANVRDIGVFVGPSATGFTLSQCRIERLDREEPTTGPANRGILVFRGQGSSIFENTFAGNYQDHIHVVSQKTAVYSNSVLNATRLGIVLIQETASENNYNENDVNNNLVSGSGGDGIQIQTDSNSITSNIVEYSGGAGIKLCGVNVVADCVAPFDEWAEAFQNTLTDNDVSQENAGGGLVDNGRANTISTNAPTAAPDTSGAAERRWSGFLLLATMVLLMYRANG